MSKAEFIAACNAATVDPAIALENENIRKALKDRDDSLVVQLLDEQF